MSSKTGDCTEQSFLKDVAKHQMTVLRDDGVHRHIQFKAPGTRCYQFDIITWPGFLCYCGDMGTYVFSRLEDMFEFFRTDRESLHRHPGLTLGINLGYWCEKLQAIDRSDGAEEFSKGKCIQAVNEHRVGWIKEDCRDMTKAERRELWQAVDDEVLCRADDGEHEFCQAIHDFTHRVGGRHFEFQDFFDCRLTEYTHRFVWCCYALAWGIQKYDDTRGTVSNAVERALA